MFIVAYNYVTKSKFINKTNQTEPETNDGMRYVSSSMSFQKFKNKKFEFCIYRLSVVDLLIVIEELFWHLAGDSGASAFSRGDR